MLWVQAEYALKGIFLGLLLYVGLQAPTWEVVGHIAIYMLLGLGAGLLIAVTRQLKELPRLFVKPHAFIVFLLLENPLLIYAGVLGGLVYGAYTEAQVAGLVKLLNLAVVQVNGASTEGLDTTDSPRLLVLAIFGAIVGYGFGGLRTIADPRRRLAIVVLVGASIVYFIILWLEKFSGGTFLSDKAKRDLLGFHILLGLPFYYLLCFVGIAEESEAEIAGLCTMLGFAIYLLVPSGAALLLPAAIFFVYTVYILPGLKVFKYTLRGYIYSEVGKLRLALLSFRRALEIDPKNQLASMGMDALHANLEIEKVDAGTLGLLDPSRCLNRARKLLAQKPTQDQMNKALHIVNLVERLWPKLVSHVIYYRAVAAIHGRDLDKASEMLTDLLNPEGWFPGDAPRKAILFDAWQLVLLVHPVLKERVGEPQLAAPGRRVEAICAVERQLALQPNDPTIVEFRKSLYEHLQERDYFESAKGAVPADFSHRYVEELGMTLIANTDHWQRGAQYLRMAANGQPLRRPSIFKRLSEAYAQAGETLQATRYLQFVRDCGLEVGIENLPNDQRVIYFGTVKRLGDEAAARDEIDEAIYNYSLATHDPTSGVPTLRALAEQYEKKKDIFNALRITEKGLCHDGRDPDMLAKKDKYYYSVEPEVLRGAAREDDNVRKYFDVSYCVKKAKGILEARNDDLEMLEWADHLIKLAVVMQPKHLIALVMKARLHLRRGERTEGLTVLEDVKEMKPSGNEELDAWYFVQKQLGTLYLDELNRPDLAIPCFLEFLNDVKSGGETHYHLGRAYEGVGDNKNAIHHYQMVLAYEGHPRYWDAQQAVRRLKGQ